MGAFVPNSLVIADRELSLLVVAAICTSAAILLPILRWAALPKPIPGIPYNKNSAKQIWGDTAEMTRDLRVRFWMRDQFARHNSPIVQIFVHPFSKPWVLLADFREAQDIMMRRTNEFDKSKRTVDSFMGVLGNSFISMKSSDHRFKHNKELVKDLMNPTFLNEVSAPEIYTKMELLLDLWAMKNEYGDGRPFRADEDLHLAGLDIMMAVTFDYPQSDTMIVKQIEHLKEHSEMDTTKSKDEPILFSTAPFGPEQEALVYLIHSIAVGFQSVVPRFAHWLYLQTPQSRKAVRAQRQLIRRNIDKSTQRIVDYGIKDKKRLKCAVDQILLREIEAADRRGVRADLHRGAIYDELFGYITGGTDTSSTTLAWWVKFIGRDQQSQLRLREELYSAHAAARSEGRLPTAREITRAHIPYLEAVVEETLRCSTIVPTVIRESIVDTQILGHQIPKGTMIFFVINAEGFLQPAFEIDEMKRAETSRQAKDLYGEWNPVGIGEFNPLRWLKTEGGDEQQPSGQEIFNPHAGPQLTFGAGPRSCFGRKLAFVELRIAVTLLTWTFEFLEMDERLSNLETEDFFTLLPRNCYVKLRKIKY